MWQSNWNERSTNPDFIGRIDIQLPTLMFDRPLIVSGQHERQAGRHIICRSADAFEFFHPLATIGILNNKVPPSFEGGHLAPGVLKHENDIPKSSFHILGDMTFGIFVDRNELIESSGSHCNGPLQAGLACQVPERLRSHVNQDAVLDCLGPGVPGDNFRVI
jgi:hypothetical protein